MIYTGCQLSSVAPYLQTGESLRRALEKIAEIGYTAVQLQGASMDIPDKEIAAALRETGLDCVASQEDYPFGFGENPQRAIARAVACGCRYLTFALLPREADTPEKLERFAEKVRKIGEMVAGAGLIFAFHPIGPDFRQMEGTPVYERLMALLPPDMQLTFCVHSCLGSGISYAEVLEKFSGRVDLVHFKDSIPGPDGKPQLMPLGAGSVDWRPVASQCAAAGVRWIFAEQERWQKDAFVCAAESYAYMQGLAHSL